MSSAFSEKQIQAQVSAIRRTLKNGAQHFAIRHSGAWDGPDKLDIDGIDHLIYPCVSDLQMRESLLDSEKKELPSVLLCSVAENDIGEDLIERLAKRRVFLPQVRDMVAELFSVKPERIDPRVLKTKTLMNALVEKVPGHGYASIPGGTLDVDTAWKVVLEQILQTPVENVSLTQFLEWSLSDDKLDRLQSMNAELSEAFVDWFSRAKGDSARYMMHATNAGFGNDLVALGLAMEMVFNPQYHREAEYQAARGRLRSYFGHKEISSHHAVSWSRASIAVIGKLEGEENSPGRRKIMNRLDEITADLNLNDYAWTSDYSIVGLDQRYSDLGAVLKKALTSKSSKSLDDVRMGITSIVSHAVGREDTERLARLEMANRLVVWLKTTPLEQSDAPFTELMMSYWNTGGFIDWARNTLKETDESPQIQAAFDAILKKVDKWSVDFENRFSTSLRNYTKSEETSEDFCLIENVLDKVVIPVAKQKPVLLLVLDGMSVPVFRQLVQDLVKQEWTEISNETLKLPRPVLSTLPSITSISRRALFLGRLDPATNGTEEGEFSKNEELFKHTGSQIRPKLFKMGDLTDGNQGGLSEEVKSTLSNKKAKVVSVVINAVDDHLDSGKQVDFTWNRNRIRGLRELLRIAGESDRLVILTSDHGHLLDHGTQKRDSDKDGRGDRFRSAGNAPTKGELEFKGTRIQKATGLNRVTLACSADIRYGKSKRGYHGGANPQEVVIPLAILSNSRSETPEGWHEQVLYQPEWWYQDRVEAKPVKRPGKPKPAKSRESLELFEHASVQIDDERPATESATWISKLLESELYREQSKLAVRGAPDSEVITKLFTELESRGGSSVKSSLARELNLLPFRLDGLIQNLSRIVNIDGYEILTLDRATETVALNIELLVTQFEIEK